MFQHCKSSFVEVQGRNSLLHKECRLLLQMRNSTQEGTILALNQLMSTCTQQGMFSSLRRSRVCCRCQYHNSKECHSSTVFPQGSPGKRQSPPLSIYLQGKLIQQQRQESTLNLQCIEYNQKIQPKRSILDHTQLAEKLIQHMRNLLDNQCIAMSQLHCKFLLGKELLLSSEDPDNIFPLDIACKFQIY